MPGDLENQIRGVIFGQAVGDALGLGTEFMSKGEVARHYPTGLHEFRQIRQDGHRCRWEPGEWTDDTDQMLCILDSLLARKEVDALDIARRFRAWADDDGMGIGETVYKVLYSRTFLRDPHGAALKTWEDSGRRGAANGAVMRTSCLGIWEYPSAERVRANAEVVSRITHADPRCVGSCVAVCFAIRALLLGDPELRALVEKLAESGSHYAPEVQDCLTRVLISSLEDLDLDEGLNPGETNRIGYTLKALSAGFWALLHASSFEEGVSRVVHEGGDADTNAAVAGALLGARFGYDAIPERWAANLINAASLHHRVDRVLAFLPRWTSL